MKRIAFYVLCIAAFSVKTKAQSTNLPFNTIGYKFIERLTIQNNKAQTNIFTNQKPFSRKDVIGLVEALDTVNLFFSIQDRRDHRYLYIENNEWTDKGEIPTKRALFNTFYKYKSDFFYKKGDNFQLKINPVFHFELGTSINDDLITYRNARGFSIRGLLHNKIGFYTYLTDNQTIEPRYVQNFVFSKYNGQDAVPGEAPYSTFGENDALDYFSYRGYISFPIFKAVQFQFGHDKHFFGNGYRSLFLSNEGAPYLFGKLSTKFWKLSYQTIWAELIEQYSILDPAGLRNRKYGVWHHLSYNATNWLNIGLFEGIIFDRENGFDLNYLNPVIFYKAIEWHVGSPDNSIIGLDAKVNFLNHFEVYGQLVFDEFRASELFKERRGWFGNKYAWQLGAKYINAFKVSHLDFEVEYNLVRPYTFAHFNTNINYTHYNQALGHIAGSNFKELLFITKYRPVNKLNIRNTFMYLQQGKNTTDINYGGNIFESILNYPQEFGNETLQGNKTTIFNNQFLVSYQLFHNLFVDGKYMFRYETNLDKGINFSTQYISIGLRLNTAHRSFMF